MLQDKNSDVGIATVLQQLPQSKMSFQAYANYAMGPLQESFSSELCLPPIYLYILVLVMVSSFLFNVPLWMPFSPMGSTIGVCITEALESIPMASIYASW